MTALLLLLLGAALLFSGALWLLLFREALKAWWYRLFPDGKSSTEEEPTYERARLLDEVGPCIVAGSDLDRARRPIDEVNRRFVEQVAPYLVDERAYEAHVIGCYVLPETSPEVQR